MVPSTRVLRVTSIQAVSVVHQQVQRDLKLMVQWATTRDPKPRTVVIRAARDLKPRMVVIRVIRVPRVQQARLVTLDPRVVKALRVVKAPRVVKVPKLLLGLLPPHVNHWREREEYQPRQVSQLTNRLQR